MQLLPKWIAKHNVIDLLQNFTIVMISIVKMKL